MLAAPDQDFSALDEVTDSELLKAATLLESMEGRSEELKGEDLEEELEDAQLLEAVEQAEVQATA